MNPETIKLIALLAPQVLSGIKDGLDIYARLTNGDETAIDQATDWLGVTNKVTSAIENWEASKNK